MADMTKAELEARLLEIEAENARLRGALDNATSTAGAPIAAAPTVVAARPRHRGRAFLGITMIVLGTLLAPIATVVGFAARQASDTDAFVATLAPLAEDPAVQALIIDEAATAIDDAIDVDLLVSDLLAQVIDADSTPRLANAAAVLGPMLADQARAATRTALTRVVESEAFATVWEEALRLTHQQLVNVLEADADGAISIDDAGVVTIQLQPIIAELKPALVDAGFTLADRIPEVTASITVAEIPAVAQARLGYSLLTTTANVLPWLAIGLIIVGVLVHPRRSRAVVVAGSLILLTGAVLGLGIALGGNVLATAIATQIPTDATAVIYGALTGETSAVLLAYVVLGVIAIIAGLLAGASSGAGAARRSGSGVLARGTAALDARGWRAEGLPTVLSRMSWLLWLWLGAIFVILAATLRPLSVADVVVGTIVLGLAAALYGILAGPRDEARLAAREAARVDDAPVDDAPSVAATPR